MLGEETKYVFDSNSSNFILFAVYLYLIVISEYRQTFVADFQLQI